MTSTRHALESLYRRLFDHYGPQHWWPAETPFEVMVGAVLTQNTAWINVERAIENLRRADLLDAAAIAALSPQVLAVHLRPSGYFNVKAKRLQALCDWLLARDDQQRLTTEALRKSLLSIHGIGPETADDILLYAYERPVFVIDAYTRRLCSRLGLLDARLPYEALRSVFERALPADVAMYNEFHALIDHHAKQVCRPKPRCEACMLHHDCPWQTQQGVLD
ncbi:MAG: endonuclease [Candidatus Thiodiazotropha sp.]